MRHRRPVVGVAVALVLLGLGLAFQSDRSPPTGESPEGYSTPEACVQAYAEALKDGDVARYQETLAEPLRSKSQKSGATREDLSETLQQQMSGVVNWVQVGDPTMEESTALVEVDVDRREQRQRLRFHLRRDESGWRITQIERTHQERPSIRPGTPVVGPRG